MIRFRVDGRSGVPPYQQIVQQVRQALRMGVLSMGDQLPSVREVVAVTAVNPNTVLKAYRDLEREGLVHRVRVDRQLRDDLLRGRQLVARPQQAEPQRVMDLLDQLEVGGDTGAGVELELDHVPHFH